MNISTTASKSDRIPNGLLDMGAYEYQMTTSTLNDFRDYHIYPNPVTDYLNILSDVTEIEYELTDSSGRVVSSGVVSNNSLSMSQFLEGLYYLTLYGGREIRTLMIYKI